MKIRHPWLIKAAIFLGTWIVRIWMRSVRYRQAQLGPEVLPTIPNLKCRFIYAFWHEFMLLPTYYLARPDVFVLISQHADGELIAGVCESLGYSTVRGSSTRGGSAAFRQMLRVARTSHLAITPDGPQGPRREVQPGVIQLAARTGLPIVPVGFGLANPWRLKSWDRFVLPKPLVRGFCLMGNPIVIPAELDPERIESCCEQLRASINEVTTLAQAWSDTGRIPPTTADRPSTVSLESHRVAPRRAG